MGDVLPAAASHGGIPSMGCPPLPLPCCIPSASHPVLSSQRVACATPKLDDPARAVDCNHAPASWT